MSEVIKQHDWTKKELRDSGFHMFNRKKRIVLARRLSPEEAPMRIQLEGGSTLVAEAGYMICYHPGDVVRDSIEDYAHWPVDPKIFEETYRDWTDYWVPTPAQRHLMDNGCKAYYKVVGVWAKELEDAVYVQSLEHEKPVLVPPGQVLAIGAAGEPYDMDKETFERSYELPFFRRIIRQFINIFRSS